MWEQENIWEQLKRKNEKVQELLRDKHSQKDVIVRIGYKQFFGFWLWDKERRVHERIAVDDMRQLVDCVVSCARKMSMVDLSEHFKQVLI